MPHFRTRAGSLFYAKNRSGKYMPHQGQQEIARRQRQQAALAAKKEKQ